MDQIALPVVVDVDARMQRPLVDHLEGRLGWQVTAGGELPAAACLRGVGVESTVPGDLPTVLLVRDDDAPVAAAIAAADADAVVAWPDDRHRLPTVVRTLARRPSGSAPVTVTIAGASGGVGTTTAMLAVGGLLAWSGRPVLAVASGDVPVPRVPTVDAAALAAHRTAEVAVAVPDVPGLRVVRARPGPRPEIPVPAGMLVLRDDGTVGGSGPDPDVLVVARDRAGLEVVEATASGIVIVADRGPVGLPAVVRALAGRRHVVVAWSARVARAAAHRRVPGGLPGRWLAGLDPLARALRR